MMRSDVFGEFTVQCFVFSKEHGGAAIHFKSNEGGEVVLHFSTPEKMLQLALDTVGDAVVTVKTSP